MASGLKRFFKYYGSKSNVAHLFPPPEHDLVVEPFAGSAGYALLHHKKRVILVEKDPEVAGIWRYLIKADPREIRALPDVEEGQSILDLDVPVDARNLIGFWLGMNVTHRNNRPCGWMCSWLRDGGPLGRNAASFWSQAVRERIASQLPAIRHWKIFHASYADCPDREVTWFIDPPYLGGNSTFRGLGSYYRVNSKMLDYEHLASWVRRRRGQVIACEGPGANWLPFRSSLATPGLCTWYRSEQKETGGQRGKRDERAGRGRVRQIR